MGYQEVNCFHFKKLILRRKYCFLGFSPRALFYFDLLSMYGHVFVSDYSLFAHGNLHLWMIIAKFGSIIYSN